MTSQRILIIATVVCLLSGAVLFRVTRDSEPVFEGKRLGEWVELLAAGNGSRRAEAEVALRQMGTNALPHLVRMLRTRDSVFKQNLQLVANLQTIVNLRLSRAADRRSRSLAAFEALGSEARAAIPELADLLNRGENPMDLARALAAVGPDTVWPLTQALAHENEEIRAAAAYGLGLLRAEGRVVVPVLVRGLQDRDYAVRFYAARSLFHLHAEPGLAVPALIERLGDTNALVRRYAARALGAYKQDARSAVPALSAGVLDPDWNARQAVILALEMIDAEAGKRSESK